MENISLITCILRTKGYFGHFDYLVTFYVRGGPTWAPHIFGGAYVARRRLVGKESDIKQTLPLLVKRRKSDI